VIERPFKPEILVPVGDMHVDEGNIAEATAFIKWLVAGVLHISATTGKKAVPIFMGDLYDKFGVKEVLIEQFWTWAYKYILVNLGYPSESIVGNHDMNQQETANALDVHGDYTVVTGAEGSMLTDTVGIIGFIRNEEKFYSKVMELYNKGARKIFCHAEFDGAQFESGYYAPHGFKIDRYPKDLQFFSGHIHLCQRLGDNIYYFGTPRHLNKSDVGTVKGIHVMTLSTGEIYFQETPWEVWSPFTKLSIEEGPSAAEQIAKVEEVVKKIKANRVYVHITGTKDFVKKTERQLPGGIKASSTYTDESVKVSVKESEGVPASFIKFSSEFFEINQVPKDIQEEVLKKVYDMCPTLRNGNI
jgi:DNA repair exonuclease SbcCD nuclease subunit